MRKNAVPFYLTELFAGGFLYCLIEILFRGYTHPSMFLLGGICFAAIGWIRRQLGSAPLAEKMLAAGVFVTLAELICGLVVNVWLGLAVWDYSAMPLNVRGQICLTYSAMWCLLAIPAMGADYVFFHGFFPSKKAEPPFQTAESVV